MAYRDILVRIDANDPGPLTTFAAGLAAEFDATLLGAYARNSIPAPFIPPDGAAFLSRSEVQRLFDAHEQAVGAAAETSRGIFEAEAAVHGVATEWTEVADPAAMIVCARRADLLVVAAGQEQAKDGLSPASLVIASGGPAIVAPIGVPTCGLVRILVAWNGSREAARALHAAWPIVSAAEAVDVLMVGRGRIGPEGVLQRHFERHGVKPNLIEHDAEDALACEILRREASERGVDMIVMGLYGHTRLREFVLGGVSREILAAPPTPLFVSH